MKKLYLGVSREIITPEIGGQIYGYNPNDFSNAIEDDLTATAFYFKQGETVALMISLTICLIHNDLAKQILDLIESELGIDRKVCMLAATHTHSGPNTAGEVGWGEVDKKYCDEIFIPAILKVSREAMNNLKAIKMGVSVGDSFVGVNRRQIGRKGLAVFGQNPDAPLDPRMTVISFKDDDGSIVANMIHYGAHCTAAGENKEITRDWPGLMIDAVEKQTGAITAFFNGPEGDIGPRISNGKTTGNLSYVYELGEKAAKDALSIQSEISEFNEAELAVSNKTIYLPLKERIPLEEAKKLYRKYRWYKANLKGLTKLHALDVIKSYDNGYADQKDFGVNQTAICIGDLIFASFPFEIFTEIGMKIDDAIAQKRVLSLSNTNGCDGYFISEAAIPYGGYELGVYLYTRLQQFCDKADSTLIDGTVEHLKNLI